MRAPANGTEAICAATDAEQGLAMLQALHDETALADVARNAKLWEVRLAAAQRVTDSALLERIAEATKHRDDRVYRYSYDLLRMRRRDLARAALAAQLAAGFRRLIESPPESRSLAAGQLRELDKALAELRAEGAVQPEVMDLAAAAHERVHADVQALRELGAAAALAEALRAEIETAATQANVAGFRERLAGLSGERPAWLAGHPTAAALATSLERAREKLDAIAPPPAPPPAPAPKREKKEKGKPFRDAHWAEIRGLLGKLEDELGAGRLADAQEIEKQIAGRAASAPLPAGLERQLKRNLAQLAQMRDWAKWGDDQGREQLIEAAEGLLTTPGKEPEQPDVEALAASVRTLRDDWKKRDATRPASKTQWERFDAVLTRAFKPVLELRAKRAAEEKAAAKARAALCDELEAWLASAQVAAAPFKEVEAKRSDLGRRVRALPFPGPQAERALRKRLEKIFKALDARLDAVRGTETRRREELIAKAESLKDAPAGDAIKSAIALQKTWQQTGGVHLGRKDDQALWARFHSATSAVFARRDEQRSKLNEQRVERKARDDRRETERRAVQQKHETHRGRFERLAARSALIERLEAAAAAGGVPDELAAEVAGAWKALPPLGMDAEKALQARFAAAPQATAAQLERGRAERESLLLDLEVALGIPSPESVAAQRRERQLKALQERFKPRSATLAETPEASVARWYSIAAPADAAQAGRMTAVVRALLLQKR